MYSLYGIHGNMKAAPIFQRKTKIKSNLTLSHSKSWKVKNADKKNSGCLRGHQFLSVTTAVLPVKIKLAFCRNYLIYYTLNQ